VAKPETLTIRNERGDVVWELERYKNLNPDTVNRSLWRTKGIQQVRGFDLCHVRQGEQEPRGQGTEETRHTTPPDPIAHSWSGSFRFRAGVR
jgi:hypothetical protein